MKNQLKFRQGLTVLISLVLLSYSLLLPSIAMSENKLKPFILAKTLTATNFNDVISNSKTKLINNGFEIIGEYAPYKNVHILIITNNDLKKYASQSENGAYGAIQRVTITANNGTIQVAFTNPTYMSHVYRFKSDLTDITHKLKVSLGFEKEYGSDVGLSKEDLREYQYKWLMPNFTDRLELAEYTNYQDAIAAVSKALTNNEGGVNKLYQVNLPGKNETLFGVSMKGNNKSECSSDKYIMSQIDFKKIKSSGHLPYEILVKNGNVYALFAEFRIAINFPDLSMMGDNSFMSIMCAPESIREALTMGSGGSLEE